MTRSAIINTPHCTYHRISVQVTPRPCPLPAGVGRVEDWCLGPTGTDGVPNVYRGFTGTLRIVDCDERVVSWLMGIETDTWPPRGGAVILESR